MTGKQRYWNQLDDEMLVTNGLEKDSVFVTELSNIVLNIGENNIL